MLSIKRLTLMVIALLMSGSVLAARAPIETAQDSRVRTVTYDPKDIVKLTIHTGIGTGVQFEQDEEFVRHYAGIDAFYLEPVSAGLVSLKPRVKYADTNLTIITNKRVYLYEIKLRDPKSNEYGLNDVEDENLTYHLFYSYPDKENQVALARYQTDLERKKEFNAAQCNSSERVDPTTFDFGYSMSGTRNISPIAVFDDGVFTYLKFHKDTPIPAIFSVDSQNNETVVNKRMRGDTVVVQQIATRYTLRHGVDVATILKMNEIAPSKQVAGEKVRSGYAGW